MLGHQKLLLAASYLREKADHDRAQVCLMAPTTAKVIAAPRAAICTRTHVKIHGQSVRAHRSRARKAWAVGRSALVPVAPRGADADRRKKCTKRLTWARTLSHTSPHGTHSGMSMCGMESTGTHGAHVRANERLRVRSVRVGCARRRITRFYEISR